MKLEIDLMKPDEVAAGLVLLGRVGEAQREVAKRDYDCNVAAAQPSNVAEVVARTTVEEGEQFYAPPKDLTEFSSSCMPTPPVLVPLDAAQVFGGSPVTVPLPPTTALPAVPVPSVPTPPIPGAVTSGAAVELDKAGLPWDSRIHSSSKNKLANGMWKVARGKAPEYVKEVEAELRGVVASPVGAWATGTVPPVISSVPPAPIIVDGVDISQPLIGRDGRMIVPVPLAPAQDPTTFETLMTRVSPAIVGGVLPATAVGAACTAAGLASVVALQSSPQFVPMVWATLKAQFPGLQ